jgi:hypothetical protein
MVVGSRSIPVKLPGGDGMARRGTALQMDIVELMVQGKGRKEIADTLNCGVRTVDDVKADKGLKQLYYERCNQQIEELLPLALRRLKGILTDDKQQGSVHVAAVREVLDRSHLKELLDVTDKQINVVISYE